MIVVIKGGYNNDKKRLRSKAVGRQIIFKEHRDEI